MQKLKALEAAVEASPDKQVSLTDPDTRLMVIGDRLTGVVGYNVQTAVDTEHHLIVAHEVTNQVGDRGQLPKMAAKAKEALGFARSRPSPTPAIIAAAISSPAATSASTLSRPEPTPPMPRPRGASARRHSSICQTKMLIAARPANF